MSKAEQLKPSTDIELIALMQNETDEAMQVIRLDKPVPFAHINDVTGSLKRCEIGGVLNAEECVEIAQMIYSGRQIKNFLENLEEDIPILKQTVEGIFPFKELERSINLKIDENGESAR